jgi:beta-phosphoglucomutase-like phosphatase (HAD superfamily)
VEDAVAGIQAAKAAGAVACGIPSTCGADELSGAGADAIIHKLEDLLEMGAGQ